MKYSIQAVSADGTHVEVAEEEFRSDADVEAEMASLFCPLATIHVYLREPFKPSDDIVEKGRFRLVLVAKFKDGEEVK